MDGIYVIEHERAIETTEKIQQYNISYISLLNVKIKLWTLTDESIFTCTIKRIRL